MQEYEVKRGLAKKTDLNQLLCQCFGECKKDGDWFATKYGAMPVIRAKYANEKLVVDTQNDPTMAAKIAKGDKAAMELAMDTQRKWNDFLFNATGYDAKTRGKKAQEAVKKAA